MYMCVWMYVCLCVLTLVCMCVNPSASVKAHVTYGNVLSAQKKVLTCVLDSKRLFVHLSHPAPFNLHPSSPPLFSLSLSVRAQNLNTCPHSACVCVFCLADYLTCG